MTDKTKDPKDPDDKEVVDKIAAGLSAGDKRESDRGKAVVAAAAVGSDDYAEVFPAIQAGIGVGTIEDAAKFYKQNRDFLDWAFGLIKSIFKKKKEQQETAPVAGEPVVPAVVPTKPLPEVTPSTQGRAVHGLRIDPYWIGHMNNAYNKAHFDAVVRGDDPLSADGHTKLHVDTDPLDQQGKEIRPGSPELKELVNSAGIPQIIYHCLLDGQNGYDHGINLGSIDPDENDPYGCTPSFKASKEVRDGRDHTLEIWATFESKTAGRLESNHLKFRVK